MPDIGECTDYLKEEDVSSSWQNMEEHVPEKYYLKLSNCNHFLRLAERTVYPAPRPIEDLLKKQGGKYPSSDPFKKDVCQVPQKIKTDQDSLEVLDRQTILSPLC